MKAIKILLIIAAVLVVIVAGATWGLNYYIQRPAFKRAVLGLARRTLRTDVQLETLRVSLFSGLELRGFAIANPAGFTGNFVTTRAFVLHYRLLPLLRGRIEVGTVSLDAPTVTLAKNARGEWNYDKLGAVAGAAMVTPTGGTGAKPGASQPGRFSARVSRIVLRHGTIVMLGDADKELLRISDAGLTAAVDLASAGLAGKGQLRIAAITSPNVLAVQELTAPVTLTPGEIRLSPLAGKVGGGALTGAVTLFPGDSFRYQADLQVANADLSQLFAEAIPRPAVSAPAPGVAGPIHIETTDMGSVLEKASAYVLFGGKLQMTAVLSGGSGLESMVGSGRVEVVEGTLGRLPLQELLASLLMLPELRAIKFQECRMEFAVSNNVVTTPVIRLKSPDLQVTGHGTLALADYTLDHQFTLAVGTNVLARLPAEMQRVFAAREDGFRTLEFRVWGPCGSPKTDLQKRVVKGAAKEFLKSLMR